MNSLEANTRNTKSKGEVRSLRLKGSVPAIIYGGTEQNEKVSVSKKICLMFYSRLNPTLYWQDYQHVHFQDHLSDP